MPSDVPAGRVLLFGGSFDPPHVGHLAMGLGARDMLGRDAWLVFVPAARSPFKSEGPIASGSDRVEMLWAASRDAGAERVGVWSDELDRAAASPSRASYWVDTVERAGQALRTAEKPRFLIGADQALAFHRWREARRILDLATPMVALRDGTTGADALVASMREAGFWSDAELTAWRQSVVGLPLVAASATEVRALLAAPRTTDQDARLAALVTPSVRAIIRARSLYK